ncbi:MAG: B-box zinc finger protein [Myxococcales bacterium]|nr:B-box zinc finger protein [Myxococcales bacterium]
MTAGELRCPAHPDAPAVAACVECGRLVCAACRTVDADGLSRCPACLSARTDEAPPPPPRTTLPPRESSAPAAGPSVVSAGAPAAALADGPGVVTVPLIPWERAGLGDIAAFVLTAREALFGPTRYLFAVPWMRGELRTPLLFAIIAGVIGQLAVVAQTAFAGPTGPTVGLTTLTPALALATAPLLPLVVTVALFFKALAAHAMLRLAGPPRLPFEATFRVYAYAEVASLLLLVPYIGAYAARFFAIFLIITGLRLAQGAGFSASLLAMAPTLLLMWVLV